MSFLNRYGTQFGSLMPVSGRVFFVAPSATYSVGGQSAVANDANDGLSPERAVLTPHVLFTNSSFGLATGDTIYFLPGDHSWTTTLTVNIAGVTLTGVSRAVIGNKGRGAGPVKKLSSITSTTTALTITAADTELAHLHFVPAVTFAAVLVSNAAADRTYIHDCTGSMIGTGDTNTMGIHLSAAVNDTVVQNCFWHNEGSNGPAVLLGNAVQVDTHIENVTLRLGGDTAWADGIKTIGVSLGNYFRDIDFLIRASGVAMTDGIDCASATTDGSSTVLRTYFAVGCALTNANVADNQCAESYTMQAAASVGGTLILST